MLLALDADLTRPSQRYVPPVAVDVQVAVTQMPSESRAFLAKSDEVWGWSDLRDYVVHEIEARFGTFPRDAKKEFGIFSRFVKEHGAASAAIARYAFEQCNGFWANAPISVNRFCKASDPFFAEPIKTRLADARAVSVG